MTATRVLSEVGWDEGFAIPVANAENKALEDELQKKQKEKSILDNKICSYRERIQAMTEHLRNVRQELSHTQALCRAREKEVEAEVHFKALAEREMGRLRQEIAKLESELRTLREKRSTQENHIFKASQKLDELKTQLNWDQQTLDAWLKESARKDEDTMALVKYAKQDESRIKELTLCIEKMTLEANQKCRVLDNERTETISVKIGVDKTGENFLQAHVERQELIQRWESIMDQMKRRNREMEQSALLLAQVNEEIRVKEATIKEKRSFLESEVQNNKEHERKIADAERLASKLRQELQQKQTNHSRLQDELESLKYNVDSVATDVQATRSKLASVKKDIQAKTDRLAAAHAHNAALQERLEQVTKSAVSVEEQAMQVENMLKESEQAVKEMDSQLHSQREVLFRQTQELQALKAQEKDAAAEVSGCRTALANLNSQLRKLDQDSLKQEKIIYDQDYQIQQLERKMAHLKGDVNLEEKLALEKKTSELSKALEEEKKTSSMLSLHLKKLQDDIRCGRKELEKTEEEKSKLTTKIEELNLFNDTSDKELKNLRMKKQETMVEDSMLKLETRRLRDLLFNKANGVLSLEMQRMKLQTAMNEREEEIKLHRDMLHKQVKMADQQRQDLSTEVHERLSKVDKMRRRYEIMTVSMAAPEGEEEYSQAYYVIKAAQQKEELQRKGDSLDAKICKTEKEIQALENTLRVIEARNDTYRKSFQKVSQSSEEYAEKLRLEEQQRAAEEKYKYKRRKMKELQEDVQNMSSTLDLLTRDENEQREKVDGLQLQVSGLNKELSSQQEKLDRVKKQCAKFRRQIRLAKKTKEETLEERDIDLRELKDFNRKVDKMLLEAMEDQPDLKATVHMYFEQANLSLPSSVSMPSSRSSSKPASARSSVSSLRSASSSRSSVSSRSPTTPSPSVKTVDLGMGLTVTLPSVGTSSLQGSRPGSTASSTHSARSARTLKSQKKSP